MCTGQEHELKALSDRMCDLGQLKETVKVFAEFYFNRYKIMNKGEKP
jgi:hypothetical protein